MSAPLSVAERNWRKLSPARQFQIALQLARTRQSRWKRRFANVQNVGAGFRTRGRNYVDQKEVVLRFVVEAKRKRIGRGRIPESLSLFWRLGRRRRALAVPTDIFVHRRGRLHQAFIGTVPDGRRFQGSACCVCRDPDRPADAPYLLSCHHVLTGSILDPNNPPRPIPGTVITRNGLPVGPCTLAGNLAPGPGEYAMDAAFLRLELPTSAAAISGFWNQVKPRRMAVMGEVPDATQPLGIFSFRGMIPARFVSVFPDMKVEIRPGLRVPFDYVMESAASAREGDSGAALMDTNGVVFGLHFYGGKSPQFPGGYALALPLWSIVGKSNYFSRNFTLVQPHP